MCGRIGGAACLVFGLLAMGPVPLRAELLVATASVDITPEVPVALSGQRRLRIAEDIETPLTANVLVLASRGGDRPSDEAVMVSCDLLSIPTDLLAMVRKRVAEQVPDLDTKKVFLGGTHTHTAPVLVPDKYRIPADGVMQVDQYRRFFAQRVADGIAQAWRSRAPGSIAWGLSHAVVAYNRRAVYADGSARMYGRTDLPEFRSLEGYEDHDVGTLFVWQAAEGLIGIVVNVSCPSQEVESRSAVNADFWHPVREMLHETYGDRVCVLGWPGAAGDQSPHLMYRKAADERMRRLRGLSRVDEIARRVTRAVDKAYEVVQGDRHGDVPLVHKVETIALPMRQVTESEYAEAKAGVEQAAAAIAEDPTAADRMFRGMKWYGETVHRFEQQKSDSRPHYDMELHVLRIGDVAVCTNAFELFTDFGIRIKARSKAVQTMVVQLVGPGSYVPTEKAVLGGGYSAIVHSSLVGPQGGQVLVERTVALIDSLWAK